MPGHARTGGRDVIFAWEQCKLGDVAKINSGKDYKGLQPGKIPVYGTGGYMLSVNDKLSDIDAIGIGRKGTIDKPYYLNAPFWTVDTLFYVTPRGTVDISFMFPLFKNINWKRYDESTGVPSLSKNTIKKIRVSFPQNNEQVKIGDLFQKITQIITLHEEKKRQLERLKSALMQKMFADKSGYPPVRFEGFSNEWEHCKLGDVADITTGSRNHQDSVTDGKYPFFVRSDKVERLNEYDFDTKAILVPGDGRIGEIFHYYNGKFALHQRVYKVDNFNGINELFLLGLFKYSFKEHALRLNAQGTVPSLRLPMFTNWSISVPMITEQERIGGFFQKLERTISLYDHKLELLKKVKRSMLQAMFI
ncbi:restriction endonuclease subunit S [Lactobacillus delbrueckii subsp. bulgaricus]|nr:restriction endonuclease subunit S [Lactobacillus delbrueckii subsp. bulgaricus]MBT8873272.1 restriction endonuclease subunit S [Lactobacillus delbrueckii subsp. bulgaricus]MBT8885921.1 restriction endonuclease subunit S [Lactobacillus delbrueckii subsp. bulgaricus]